MRCKGELKEMGDCWSDYGLLTKMGRVNVNVNVEGGEHVTNCPSNCLPSEDTCCVE